MLIVLLNLRPAIEKYCQEFEEELEDDILSYDDWKKLRTIKDILQPFSRATLYAEGDSPSIDATLFMMDVLIKYLQETNDKFKAKTTSQSQDRSQNRGQNRGKGKKK
ncbi:hypothetical protein L207DRAFT_519685 [Hyaloscypha variabilis F]|uniref:Uncharacterized protein n=1 Tax=Hyaloscypha variabilis (strain UAMH 11265 / GT02V1 / F) TaxID=1149755 RepID=A0A2J6QXP1_HYAVF|nr:hypothetical protein L207DRAFT_519685 [Hyaloscypha variabilis F]